MLTKRGKSGTYYVDFVYRGQRYQKTTESSSLRRAREFEAHMREALRLGTYGLTEHQAPSLQEHSEAFLESIQIRRELKPMTISFYKTKVNALLSFPLFSRMRIDQIHEGHIERFTQWRLRQVAPGTVDLELTTLGVLLRTAYKWKKLSRVPVITKLHRSKPREFVLDHEQELSYLETCPQPLRDIADLLLQTGLRLNEALQLKWEDLDWTSDTEGVGCWLSVHSGKSRNAVRCIPVPLQATRMLRLRQNTPNASQTFVFPSRTGKPYVVTSIDHMHSRVRRVLMEQEETRERAPWDEFVLHSLRHTYLSRLGESGADAFAIMKLAGHGQVTTSQRYMHPSSEHLARTVARLTRSRSPEVVQSPNADLRVPPANFTASFSEMSVSC